VTEATFEAEWARCSPWLDAALASLPARTHELSHVRQAVETGEATFWPGASSAAVVQIETYPLLKAANIWLAGGDLTELRDVMRPRFEAWAVQMGCRWASATGRQGFGRAIGYRPIHWTCAKELTPCP
jgi:hypothetical protein